MAKQTTTKASAPEVEEQPQTTATPTAETVTERKSMTLAAKILAAKAKIGKISKDGSAIVEKASGKTIQYATLPQVLGAVVPVLAELGLDYVVAPVWSEIAVQLMAQNMRMFSIHFVDVESGEQSEPIVYPFRMANNYEAIKGDGSTITYATRYLLGLALGLQTEEDPDNRFPERKGGNNQQQRGNNQQPAQQPQQPKKQRTFRECVNGFYATYNKGDLDGARRTLDFVRKNWGRAEECAAEIAAMEKLDLTVWQPTQPDAPQQSQTASATADANTTAPF
ncbi:MAG: ERF family protein [Clostridia bacterium]|nr:ERF family protein [Clostridia bacterium]